ncbi:MAG: energy-coupling factor transporter transmembrane protein EcfT [Deltaproteobacteria bacterium]|nr:energy-coupling factor transporter transmembrane protein EcfT [Deltaproteobacteria bacterium]
MFHLGQYIPRPSVVHRLDPRVKILATLMLSMTILRADPAKAAVLSVFLVGGAWLSRLSWRDVATALRPLVFFFCFLFLLHLFFTDGRPLFAAFPVVTVEGLSRGLITTWQFMALVVCAALLTMTTTPSELISGIERLLRPLRAIRISSHDLAIMVSLALRFVPTLLLEFHRLREAQLSRGADFREGTVVERLRKVSSLASVLVIQTFQRADELVQAMEGRGYERGPRTYLRELKMGYADYTVMISTLVFVAALHALSI